MSAERTWCHPGDGGLRIIRPAEQDPDGVAREINVRWTQPWRGGQAGINISATAHLPQEQRSAGATLTISEAAEVMRSIAGFIPRYVDTSTDTPAPACEDALEAEYRDVTTAARALARIGVPGWEWIDYQDAAVAMLANLRARPSSGDGHGHVEPQSVRDFRAFIEGIAVSRPNARFACEAQHIATGLLAAHPEPQGTVAASERARAAYEDGFTDGAKTAAAGDHDRREFALEVLRAAGLPFADDEALTDAIQSAEASMDDARNPELGDYGVVLPGTAAALSADPSASSGEGDRRRLQEVAEEIRLARRVEAPISPSLRVQMSDWARRLDNAVAPGSGCAEAEAEGQGYMEDIREVLSDAYDPEGVEIWLDCCPYGERHTLREKIARGGGRWVLSRAQRAVGRTLDEIRGARPAPQAPTGEALAALRNIRSSLASLRVMAQDQSDRGSLLYALDDVIGQLDDAKRPIQPSGPSGADTDS